MATPSPCISVCKMHPSLGWCEGCGRSIDEIAAWGSLDDAARWRVWKLLPARKQALEQALFDAPDGTATES
jgi:predicted Fe-S protein YdhL (DUF1289 family)